MSKFRRIILAALCLNALLLVAYNYVPAVYSTTLDVPIDDWQFRVDPKFTENPPPVNPIEFFERLPLYLIVFWLGIEMLYLITMASLFPFVTVSVIVLLVAASVSGPMIGSITDQGVMSAERSSMSYSVGGAKDMNNFRANIAAGYLPRPSDITYEGLFYDYSFVTGKSAVSAPEEAKALFRPTWSAAVSNHPISGETSSYLAVGLKSDLDAASFKRRNLNLVVVLDISGSMSSPFNRYYYGGRRLNTSMTEDERAMTKLNAACRSIVAMIDHLGPEDRLGIVLFDHRAYVAKPITRMAQTNVETLKQHILALQPQGATNMEEGLSFGESMLKPFSGPARQNYENRIIFLTDAMPNTDDASEEGLLGQTRTMADNRTFVTFIGMGVDFNTEMVEALTKVRGANYLAVHSPADFKKRLADEFDCLVSPLLFDLNLKFTSDGYRIKKVVGSPDAQPEVGSIMHVRTLFPSPTTAEGGKGSVILLELEKIGKHSEISLEASYEDRDGQKHSCSDKVVFPEVVPEYFEDNGIRKAVLLARYVDLLKKVATRKHARNLPADNMIAAAEPVNDGSGWSYWERPGRPLEIAQSATPSLSLFQRHFLAEIETIGDESLKREIHVLKNLEKIAQ